MAKGPEDTPSARGQISRRRSVDQSVGRRIKARRLQVGVSLTDLAQRLEVPVGHLLLIEEGMERPTPKLLTDLCPLLKCSIRFLFAGADQDQGQPSLPPVATPDVDSAVDRNALSTLSAEAEIAEIVSICLELSTSERRQVLKFVRALG